MRSGDSGPGFGASGNTDLSLPSSILNTTWIPGRITQGSGEHNMDPSYSRGRATTRWIPGKSTVATVPTEGRAGTLNEFIRSFVLLLTAISLARESSSWLSRFD
ncbi:unnamed protein product, partial [Ectocarpus sp. 12 AP-2014]